MGFVLVSVHASKYATPNICHLLADGPGSHTHCSAQQTGGISEEGKEKAEMPSRACTVYLN